MKRWDLILFGATGFTGRYAARYLDEYAPEGISIALAGRSKGRLEALSKTLKRDVDLIVADVTDEASVDAMVAQARVIATTVGPYTLYGTPVVTAALRHGTHYCDITGETPWVRELIDAHHEQAEADGVCVVPLCGFDSIPSDLGTWMMVNYLRSEYGLSTRRVRGWFQAKGGLNGGTLASALTLNQSENIRRMAHPFLLSPGFKASELQREESADPRRLVHHPQWGWSPPFFMGAINTRVVRRSQQLQALRGEPYGEDFTYQEYLGIGAGQSKFKASTATFAQGLTVGLLSSAVGRTLAKLFGPKPGQGPSEAMVRDGFFKLTLLAEASDGTLHWGKVVGDGDPGNANTVRMLCESALCLVESEPSEVNGGVVTPSVAMGPRLLARLRAAGMTWEAGVDAPTR